MQVNIVPRDANARGTITFVVRITLTLSSVSLRTDGRTGAGCLFLDEPTVQWDMVSIIYEQP